MPEGLFTLGSTQAEVGQSMGTPIRITGWTWYYGEDTVSFDLSAKVTSWNNRTGKLRVTLGDRQPDANAVKLGSTIQQVGLAVGTPTQIIGWTWYYGEDSISFGLDGLVTGWQNVTGTLNVGV